MNTNASSWSCAIEFVHLERADWNRKCKHFFYFVNNATSLKLLLLLEHWCWCRKRVTIDRKMTERVFFVFLRPLFSASTDNCTLGWNSNDEFIYATIDLPVKWVFPFRKSTTEKAKFFDKNSHLMMLLAMLPVLPCQTFSLVSFFFFFVFLFASSLYSVMDS